MKNCITFIAAMLLSAGCVLFDDDIGLNKRDGTYRSRRNESDGGNGGEEKPETVFDTLTYVTGIEYPEGYDRVRDTAYGTADCRIVLFRNAERIVEVPAGYIHETSTDPDMHRIADGHVYTDFSTDAETVVKCDGRELFRYSGREMMKGFLVRDGRVHTLGQNRSGEGFSYRIDGKTVFSRDKGRIIGDTDDSSYEGGALYEDESSIFFSYTDGAGWYIVEDGTERVVTMPSGVNEVFDIRMYGGRLYRSVSAAAHGNPVLYTEGEMNELGQAGSAQIPRICRIVPGQENIMVKGYYSNGSVNTYRLWAKNKPLAMPGNEIRVCDFYENGGDWGFVGIMSERSLVVSRPNSILTIALPASYRFNGNSCATLCGGKFYLALSPAGDGLPAVWTEDKTETLDLNGILTGIKISVIPRQAAKALHI